MKRCITAWLVLSDPERILCECDSQLGLSSYLSYFLVPQLDMTRRIMITLVKHIYVGFCLFSPLQGTFYTSAFNTLLSATWQGICQGYHCLRSETIHACGVCHFSLFGPSNAQAPDGICKGHAWFLETHPEVFQLGLFEAGNTSEEIITLWSKFLWSLRNILKDSQHGSYFRETLLDVICFMLSVLFFQILWNLAGCHLLHHVHSTLKTIKQ